MLAPIRPSPTMPMSIAPPPPAVPVRADPPLRGRYRRPRTRTPVDTAGNALRRRSAGQPDRHEEEAVVRARRLAGQHRGLGRAGEGETRGVAVDRAEPVEEVGRFEGDRHVLALVAGFERLRRLSLVPPAGLEDD